MDLLHFSLLQICKIRFFFLNHSILSASTICSVNEWHYLPTFVCRNSLLCILLPILSIPPSSWMVGNTKSSKNNIPILPVVCLVSVGITLLSVDFTESDHRICFCKGCFCLFSFFLSNLRTSNWTALSELNSLNIMENRSKKNRLWLCSLDEMSIIMWSRKC